MPRRRRESTATRPNSNNAAPVRVEPRISLAVDQSRDASDTSEIEVLRCLSGPLARSWSGPCDQRLGYSDLATVVCGYTRLIGQPVARGETLLSTFFRRDRGTKQCISIGRDSNASPVISMSVARKRWNDDFATATLMVNRSVSPGCNSWEICTRLW